jgi:hypothetical protein
MTDEEVGDRISWIMVRHRAHEAETARKIYISVLRKKSDREERWERFFVSGEIKYWYLILAFSVGLRLSRITAEIIQDRPKKTVFQPEYT